MSTSRTENPLLQDRIMGPMALTDSEQINALKKNLSSRNSMSSDISLKEVQPQNSNTQGQDKLSLVVQILKAKEGFQKKHQVSNSNFFKGSKRQLLEPRLAQHQERQNFFKAYIINKLIYKFKRNLLQSSYVLPEQMKEILADEPYIQEQKEKQKKTSKAKITAKKQEKLTKMLMPGRNLTIIWDLISLIIQFLSLFLCTTIASFGQSHHFYKVSVIFINTFLLLEAILSIHRPIINQGEIVTDYSLIFSFYAKSQLLEDFLSFIIWFLIFFNFDEYIVLNEIMAIILFIITIRKISRKYNIQIEYLYLKGFNSNVLDIVTLIILICFYAHTMGCLWHYIGKKTESQGSWLTHLQINNESTWVQYNYSFYWAVTTMVTVGYGDITPHNQTEITFVIIMMLLSSCMFAYSMNSIGLIVKQFYDEQTRFKRTLILINQFMSKNQVDRQIQSRVRNYIRFSIQNEMLENKEDTIKIIDNLPVGLKSELEEDIQSKVIQKIKLFTSNFSQQSQNLVKAELTEIKYTPNDIIFHQNDIKDKNLYFISEGKVQVFDKQSKRILKTMQGGEIFGEFQFFTGQSPKESIMSVGFTQLYKIDRDKFISIVKQHQKDFERFHKIKDLILFSNNYQVIQKTCSICKQTNHSLIQCPYLTYQPNMYIKILKQNKKEINNRGKYERSLKKINSLSDKAKIKESVEEYRDNLSETYTEDIDQSQQITNTLLDQQYLEEQRSKSNISLTKHLQQLVNQKRESKANTEIDKKKQQSQVFSKKKPSLVEEERRTVYRDTILFKQLDQFYFDRFNSELEGFDQMQNYSEYFPHNNLLNQVKNYNREKIKLKNKSSQLSMQKNFFKQKS